MFHEAAGRGESCTGTESKNDKAAGPVGLNFSSYDYVHHFINGQLLRLMLMLGLQSGLGSGPGL